MANTREEVLNTVVASMLSKYDSIEAAPEQREGPEAIDITVRHENARNTEVVIEAKIGTSAGKKKGATKQVRQRLESRPSAMAFAVCYPNDLKSLASLSQLETGMANTHQLWFAPVTRVGKAPTWREGSVQEFASVLFQNDLPQSNVADAIEYSVRQAADLISDRTLFSPAQAEKLPPLLAEALALPSKTPKDKRAAVLIATLMISNAALLHHRLRVVDNLLDVPSLQDCMDRGNDTFLRAMIDAWKAILKIDYHPVFDPAVSVLETFMAVDHNARMSAVHAVRLLVKYALAHADDLAVLRFDHAGPLYHRLLESARYDGSFYTNNVSALLLARLALTKDFTDWSDEEGLGKLRVIDPACGTGTLLMAAMHTISDRYINAAGQDADFLHLFMVEDVLQGLDINRHGIQLAACNLTLGNPRVDYTKMNLFTMHHGPQADGKTHIGSLELLATAEDDGTPNLTQFISPLPRLENLEAERAQPGDVNGDSYVGTFDVVIMNPPFTRNDIRNRQYTASDRKRIQDREKEVVDFVSKRDPEAGGAIDHTNASSFFTPLADMLLKKETGVLAKVLPTTALTNTSGRQERMFLANRFQIETIITSHDPYRINFSENTKIHESLLIARRPSGQKPTRFISLGRMPTDAHEAMLLANMINSDKISGEWGRECEWPWERVREGDWQVALFYDEALAEAYYDLAALNGTRLNLAGNACKIEPAGQRVRDAFSRNNSKLDTSWKTPVLWDHQTDVRTTMAAEPDVVATPKRGREKYARGLTKKASRLVISGRLYTYAVRTAACYTEEPVLGSAWVPVTSLSTKPHFDQALCAWWNSTPGILTMLHARSKKLTYPAYSLDLLRKLLIPNPRNVDVSPLIDVFAKTHQQVLKPWKEMDTCSVRALIDEAAAQVLHMDGMKIADWRKRITLEPTVSNRPAVEHFG